MPVKTSISFSESGLISKLNIEASSRILSFEEFFIIKLSAFTNLIFPLYFLALFKTTIEVFTPVFNKIPVGSDIMVSIKSALISFSLIATSLLILANKTLSGNKIIIFPVSFNSSEPSPNKKLSKVL